MQGNVNKYLFRIIIFLSLVVLTTIFLYPVLISAFISNIYINSVILFSLLFGVVFNIYQLNILRSNYSILASFNIHKTPQSLKNNLSLTKNLIKELKEIDGRYTFLSSNIDNIVESIDMNLSLTRETSRYLVGLLVFLGLLGTFWGLLNTIGSVGNVISSLGVDDTNLAGFFDNLKDGLKAPLEGMSIAFSSSLLGLAGSLILGFIDLQLGQAQNKFSQYAEKIITQNSSPDFISSAANSKMDSRIINSIQKIYDNLDSLVFTVKETTRSQKELNYFIQSLTEHVRELATLGRSQEKKLSNFLSSQINTQASILEFTSQLSKEGLMDKKTKLHLQNIDKGIKLLINKLKK